MIVVFYSLATGWHTIIGILQTHEIPSLRAPRPGEGLQVVEPAVFDAYVLQRRMGGDRDPIQEYLNAFTGMTPQPCEYAIVQAGVVVNVMGRVDPLLHADDIAKTIADFKGSAAIPTVDVRVGATYLNGIFTNPVEAVAVKQGASLGG